MGKGAHKEWTRERNPCRVAAASKGIAVSTRGLNVSTEVTMIDTEVDAMAEIIELLEGCVDVLTARLEDGKDPELTLIRNALLDCVVELDEIWETGK